MLHDDREAGQSAAALIGIAHARDAGFERALLVPGDAPLLDPAELSALLARPEPLVIVPDRHGTGTNGLLLAPVDAFEPSFGPGSRARHEAAARATGLPWAIDPLPSLVLDVDTPEDLEATTVPPRWRARDPGGAAAPLAARVSLTATALEGVPEVRAGDDLAALLAATASSPPATSWWWPTRWCPRPRAGCATWPPSSPASAPATWPPSTARTRGWCRWCWTSRPRCCAPTTAC